MPPWPSRQHQAYGRGPRHARIEPRRMEREAMAMVGEMTAVLQGMFGALDKSDPEMALASIGADAQGIDEISRRWMRGPGEVTRYVRELFGIAEDVHSEMHDVHEVDWGETGVVTFWLEQDYTLDGTEDTCPHPRRRCCDAKAGPGSWRCSTPCHCRRNRRHRPIREAGRSPGPGRSPSGCSAGSFRGTRTPPARSA